MTTMKMSKLSNQTNSQDPQAVNSRVFVGNLNTFQCSKTDVERMFQIYGRLAGISMHKGYAFVQFTNPFDARNACHGEDGRTVLSQTLDVNMVAEPKPHQVGRKRQNVTKTGNDWDYYYDSYYSSTLFRSSGCRALKRKRIMSPQGNNLLIQHQQVAAPSMSSMSTFLSKQHNQMIFPQQIPISNGPKLAETTSNQNAPSPQHGHTQCVQEQQASTATEISTLPTALQSVTSVQNDMSGMINCEQISALCESQFQQHQHKIKTRSNWEPYKIYSNPDTLICGNCREYFADLSDLLSHKRSYCKLRFTCKCQDLVRSPKSPIIGTKLLCAVCKEAFANPWELMVHAQAAHLTNIYELGNETNNNNAREDNEQCIEKVSEMENVSNRNQVISDDISKADDINTLSSDLCTLNGTKEESHIKKVSMNVQISANPSDDVKSNGSVSSRGSSPGLENTCIVRTLNIETSRSSSQAKDNSMEIMTSGIAISLTNRPTTVLLP